MVSINIMGRIDELDTIATPALLLEFLVDCAGCLTVVDAEGNEVSQPSPAAQLEGYMPMYQPLGLSGTYMVTGIEGKYYDGYVPNDPAGNDTPWPLEVTPNMSAFDIMQAVAASEANGYPNINHVWFEGLDIEGNKLMFSMGS